VDPQEFATCLDNALSVFRDLRNGKDYLVSAYVNAYHRSVWVRFVQRGACENWNGQLEPVLEPAFRSLRAVVAQSGGELHYCRGNNYLDLSLPFRGVVREEFSEVEHLPWDERFRQLLKRATWGSLRAMVFRFSKIAERFAARSVEFGMSRVLIPSVGLCV